MSQPFTPPNRLDAVISSPIRPTKRRRDGLAALSADYFEHSSPLFTSHNSSPLATSYDSTCFIGNQLEYFEMFGSPEVLLPENSLFNSPCSNIGRSTLPALPLEGVFNSAVR
jgi:hypothetical protein